MQIPIKKFAAYLIISIILTLGLSISLQSLLAAWTAPTASPPGDNVNRPLYATSSVIQMINKEGGTGGSLGVEGNFSVGDDTYFAGKVGIGTNNPGINNLEVNPDGIPNNGDEFVIDASGNVGIGINPTSAKLEIAGTNGTALQINNGGDLVITPQFSGSDTTLYNDIGILNVSTGLEVNGELRSINPNQARFVYGNYGVIHRNDGNNYYILLTNSGDAYGGWNTLRPFYINDASGAVNIDTSLCLNGDCKSAWPSGGGYTDCYGTCQANNNAGCGVGYTRVALLSAGTGCQTSSTGINPSIGGRWRVSLVNGFGTVSENLIFEGMNIGSIVCSHGAGFPSSCAVCCK